jgi:hypothetical protein
VLYTDDPDPPVRSPRDPLSPPPAVDDSPDALGGGSLPPANEFDQRDRSAIRQRCTLNEPLIDFPAVLPRSSGHLILITPVPNELIIGTKPCLCAPAARNCVPASTNSTFILCSQ